MTKYHIVIFTAILLAFFQLLVAQSATAQPKCLFVSSYHKGYAWSDRVEKALRNVLQGRCELRQFNMDTKHRKTEPDKQNTASQAYELIKQWQPDIVITADDNAARYLVQPYLKNTDIPVVFCGINWSVKEYGFPYTNATGMVEVAPIRPMIKKALELTNAKTVFYLGANTTTEKKNLERFQNLAENMGLKLKFKLVDTMQQWLEAYQQAQQSDLLIIGSYGGIRHWNQERAIRKLRMISRKLSVTSHEWMMPVSMLGFTKIPEEQGEWAGKTALAILSGTDISKIPVIANRKWDLWINPELLKYAGVSLPDSLKRRAKRIE